MKPLRWQELHNQPVYWTCWPCDHDLCIDCARLPRVLQLREPEKVEMPLRSPDFQPTRMDGWSLGASF